MGTAWEPGSQTIVLAWKETNQEQGQDGSMPVISSANDPLRSELAAFLKLAKYFPLVH